MPLTELEDENHKLKETDARLRKELELLKTHPVFLAAIQRRNARLRFSRRTTDALRRNL